MSDLTDDELLEQLSAKPDCGCLTCRMVHEIQRRRAAHAQISATLDQIGSSENGRITFNQYHGILAEMHRAEGK